MSIENDIFNRYRLNTVRALAYGFLFDGCAYTYKSSFLDGQFHFVLKVSDEVMGKVYESEFEEEYVNIRIESFKGEFVSKVRSCYEEELMKIRMACFDACTFVHPQANRVDAYIEKKYGILPEDTFHDEDIRIFRSSINSKWFGLIMRLKGKRFNKNYPVEILNVKLNPDEILSKLQMDGFYVAYHMDKKNWISICLDDSLDDSVIFSCIDASYDLIHERQYWIVPANPKYYDVFSHFEDNEIIEWKQTVKANVHDIVYIYVTQPYRCILYKCLITEVDIPYSYQDDYLSMKKIMRCQLLHKYNKDEITMESLSKLGVANIRCTRKIKEDIIVQFDREV